MLKERADWVTEGASSEGVAQLIERMLATDLRELEPKLSRHDIALGTTLEGKKVTVHAYGPRLLLCGTSGSGKSTLASGFLERLHEHGYQYCLVDPEGDFASAAGALVVGDEQKAPTMDEVISVLKSGESSVVANLLGMPLAQRPLLLGPLFARFQELRSRFGRPHWIIMDEAHHMIPEGDVTLPDPVTNPPTGVLLITVHPERVATAVLTKIDTLIVVGKSPAEAVEGFAQRAGIDLRLGNTSPLAPGEALIWSRQRPERVERFRVLLPKAERQRHQRKYASGDLGRDKSFYFRGKDGALNLRAHNLTLFLQMADGVDDATWLHHLAQHDYSAWLRDAIKNEALAAEVASIEDDPSLDASESRWRVRAAIERIYTLPA